MGLRKKVFAFSAFLSTSLFATVNLDGFYEKHPGTMGALGLGATVVRRFSNEFHFNAGASLWQGVSRTETLQYRGMVHYDIAAFYTFSLRLDHRKLFIDDTSATHAMLSGEFMMDFAPWVGVSWALGGWTRFQHLGNAPLVPTPWNGDLHDEDYGFGMYVHVRPSDLWRFRFGLATFDDFEIDNLQNPHFSLRLKYRGIEAFAKYKVLLGFGRLDSFTVGVSLPLSPQVASGS